MHWIVFDYGEVIALPPTAADFQRLAGAAGAEAGPFEAAYWRDRDKYDRGMPDLDYWQAVGAEVGVPLADATIEALVALDVAMWGRADPATVELLESLAAAGRHLALLSNAPSVHGAAFRRAPWAGLFEHIVVSGDLGIAKPDAAIWAALLERLGAEAGDVMFLDDRAVNIDGARAAGIHGLVWDGADRARAAIAAF